MRHQLGYATMAILDALRRGNRFGLDIMRDTSLPSGTVYPTLARAEQAGFIRGRWEDHERAAREGRPRRRHYELTAAGDAALTASVRRADSLVALARRALRKARS
jgi:PadR family transcriptional regulator, regulatory protein PadR